MSILKTLIYRLRLKLKDTDATTYSSYDISDAINETLRELKKIVTQYYDHLDFLAPNKEVAGQDLPINSGETIVESDSNGITEDEETGFPVDFDELIIEYAIILLAVNDYATKEQAKALWKQKVISLASTMDKSINLLDGCYESYGRRHILLLKCLVGEK